MSPPVWNQSGRLWSLSDIMEQINAGRLLEFASQITHMDSWTWLTREKGLTDENCDALSKDIDKLLNIGVQIAGHNFELPSTIDQLKRIDGDLKNGEIKKPGHGWHLVRALHERVLDEMGRGHVFYLSRRDVEFFAPSEPHFGQPVYEAFPSAIVDIEEAGKCLGLERSTAAVFHLMRVMEVGLKATANALGVVYAPSWESYLRQMKPLVETEWSKKPQEWRAEEPFLKDVYSHLYAVKLAWRNPVMHVRDNYTPEMAREIFAAVKGFMRHLATKLTEKTAARTPSLIPADVAAAAASEASGAA